MTSSRAKRIQGVLVGDSGAAAAVAAWTVIALLWVVAFLLGAFIVPVVLAVTVTAVVLTMSFTSSWRAGRIIMLGALAVWAVCSVAFWWLWGVGFEAADAFQPEPSVMVLSGPAFVVGCTAFAVFFVTLGIGVLRRRRTRNSPLVLA